MKATVLIRKIHHWGSICIALQLGVAIVAGIFLMLKKEVDWIQPPTRPGASLTPTATFADMLAAVKGVPQAKVEDWRDLARVDLKPDKGVVKFVSENNWEIQVDATTAEVLQVAFRRSDIIEHIHDGSYFAGWTKLFLFLPTGMVLLVLWGTGLYMFFQPYVVKARKRSNKRARAARHAAAAAAPEEI